MSRNNRSQYQTHSRNNRLQLPEQEFRCLQCGLYILCAPTMAGVQNRNHCPYCLWSRHLDWRSAGDRLSGCRAAMQPVGLTTKRSRNKYARERDGELMVIHECTICEKVVINRIAADDSAASLLAVFESSFASSAAFEARLADSGVSILTADDSSLVWQRLFGKSHLGIEGSEPGHKTSQAALC